MHTVGWKEPGKERGRRYAGKHLKNHLRGNEAERKRRDGPKAGEEPVKEEK